LKTQPLPKPLSTEPSFSLADQVLFRLASAREDRRMLLATAIALISQCVLSGLPFEVLTLDRQAIARLGHDTLTAHPVILGALSDMEPLIRALISEVRESTLLTVRDQLLSESAVSSP